jgi:hypothetical protein
MSDDVGLYSESARAFFVRQQQRRHEEQLLAERLGPQPSLIIEPDEAMQDLDDAMEVLDEAIGVVEAENDGPPEGAEDAMTGELESTSVMPLPVRYRARVVSDGDSDGVFDVQDGTTIGRAPGVEIRIDHPDVSRHHARFTLDDDLLTIADLGSTNGTVVNDAPLEAHASVTVAPGDTLQIGSPNLLVTLEQA